MSLTTVSSFPDLAPAPLHPAAVRRSVSVEVYLAIAYAIFLPFQIRLSKFIRIAPSDFFVILIVVFFWSRLTYRHWAWSIWHVALLATFGVGSLITSFRTGDLSSYVLLNKDVGILLFLATYLTLSSVADGFDAIRMILRAFISSVALQNLVGLVVFLGPYFGVHLSLRDAITVYNGQRLAGWLVDPNAYGGLLVLALVMGEVASSGPKPLFRSLWLNFCRLSLGLGILFTFSRTAWVGLILTIPFMISGNVSKFIKLGFISAFAAVLTFALAGDRLTSLVKNMIWRPEQGTGRGELVSSALNQFSQNPVFGRGLGAFMEEQGIVVHNTALWFLADFGLVGIVVFVGFIGWFLLSGWRARRMVSQSDAPVVYALVVGHIAMIGVAMGIDAFYQRHWWMVMALIGASCHIAYEQHQAKEQRRAAQRLAAEKRLPRSRANWLKAKMYTS